LAAVCDWFGDYLGCLPRCLAQETGLENLKTRVKAFQHNSSHFVKPFTPDKSSVSFFP
jgi:hypothetical protein